MAGPWREHAHAVSIYYFIKSLQSIVRILGPDPRAYRRRFEPR